MSDIPLVARAYRNRTREIISRLEELDRLSIRPSRAVASGYGTPQDEANIRAYESEAIMLRAELKSYTQPGTPQPPVTIVTRRVTARQAHLALLNAGLLEAVKDAISALPENIRPAVEIEWSMATHFDRDSLVTQMIAGIVGLTSEQMDQLFEQASTL